MESRIKLLARQVITGGLDLLFPPICVNCGRVGSFLCPRCMASVAPAAARSVPGLDGIRVRAGFEGAIQTAIHAFKYERQTRLAEPLGELLCQALREVDWPVDVVAAVPLHSARLRERGYNQAALLTRHVAQAHFWEFAPTAIQRIRDTPSQINLNARERQANVHDAFSADGEVFEGACVLLVDDVLTTGATLVACADALRAAGAGSVFGATVAGAVGFRDAQ